MTTAERRRLRSLAEQFPAAREALLSLAGPPKKVKPERRQRLAAVKSKRAAVTAETRAIREAVMQRAEGKCERCGIPCSPSEAHMHHLRGGSGRRREEQAPENCAALCYHCHATLHDNPEIGRKWAVRFMARAPRAAGGAQP